MGKLYVRMGDARVELEQDIAAKYSLRSGMRLPFTGYWIEGEAGPGKDTEEKQQERPDIEVASSVQDSEFITLENGLTLSQSEILDFADGRDNSAQDEL